MAEELPRMSYVKNIWNIQTGQNTLWTGPKAEFCPKEVLARITRKQILFLPDP